jgi:ATP-dependent protease Clp ATPase subunit
MIMWKQASTTCFAATRGRSTSIGFGAKVAAPEDRKAGEVFREVEPEDLLKYGRNYPDSSI